MKQNIEFNFKLFSSEKHKKWRAKPGRDWKIVFWSAFIFASCLTGVHLFLFTYLLSHETFSPIESTLSDPKRTLNQKVLEEVLLDFQKKDEVTKKLLAEPPLVADPGRP